MVDGLFFCATLTGRRGGYTPFVLAGADTSYTSAEAVKPDPRCSWEGYSEGVGAGVGDESAESYRVVRPPAFHWWSVWRAARMLLLSLSDKLRSCATGTNGCLDLRRRAFALGGQLSAKWSRCPGSMARRTGDSVAPLRQSSAGWMPARIGRLSTGVGRRHPVTIRKTSLMAGQKGGCEHCDTPDGSAVFCGWIHHKCTLILNLLSEVFSTLRLTDMLFLLLNCLLSIFENFLQISHNFRPVARISQQGGPKTTREGSHF